LFSKDHSALARLLKLLSATIFFPQGKIFQTANNFSCYIRAVRCKTEGLYPKIFLKRHTARVARAFEPRTIQQKLFSGNQRSECEQFFRQCERNKPEELARRAVSDFQNAPVLKHCLEDLAGGSGKAFAQPARKIGRLGNLKSTFVKMVKMFHAKNGCPVGI
jgi:hypothetical protein